MSTQVTIQQKENSQSSYLYYLYYFYFKIKCCKFEIPYRLKIRGLKVTKFFPSDENFNDKN